MSVNKNHKFNQPSRIALASSQFLIGNPYLTSGFTSSKKQLVCSAQLVAALSSVLFSLPSFAIECVNGSTSVSLSPTFFDDNFKCQNGEIADFDGLGGNDKLELHNTNNSVSINGNLVFKAGNDALTIDKNNATNDYSISATSSISMGGGNDIVRISNTSATDLMLNASINLGADNDTFNASGKLHFSKPIHGDAGIDKLNFGSASSTDLIIINADVFGDDGNDSISLGNTKITGVINGGTGDDTITIFNKSSFIEINGDDGIDTVQISGNIDTSNPNLKITGGAGNDILRIDGAFNSSLVGSNITDFESIYFGREFGGVPPKILLKGNQLTLGMHSGDPELSQILIHENVEIRFDSNSFTFNTTNATLQNAGKLNLRGSTPGKTVTINGNYQGFTDSKILMNTQLKGDTSATDKLVINGNSSGTSAVNVANVGGTGAKTLNGIPIIVVQGSSNAVFTLDNKLQVGGFEYLLVKKGKNWHLVSTGKFDNNSTPSPTPSSASTNSSTTPAPQIYRPAVAGYLQATQTLLDLNSSLLSRFELRQQNASKDGDIWGRALADKTQHKTSNFGYAQQNQQLQFGKKLVELNPKTQIGVTFGVAQQTADYYDNSRTNLPTGSYSGKSSTTQLMVGATYTIAQEQNSYIDLQGQINSSSTQLTDIYDGTAKQTGVGLALSAEMGKVMPLGNTGFGVTPQAQLVFQNNKQTGFTDAISIVSKQTTNSLRLRAGATLQSSKAKALESKTNWNASINLWQEWLDNPSRNVADTKVSANHSQKPWLELGLGLRHQLSDGGQLKAQISHQHSLSGSQRRGNAVNVSYQLKW